MATNRQMPMPTRRTSFQLARIFGIRIGVSGSWFLFLALLILFLASYFHSVVGGSQSTAYGLAVAGAIGYFASLILHELGHALVARRVGIPIAGIDLWFFGGLARMRREPQTPGQELKVAAAGPALTFLALIAFALAFELTASNAHFTAAMLTREAATITPALALLGWLALINAVVLVFNLLPAFPLDGGRIARALIWWRTKDRHRGTRATGRAGQGLALLLGLAGVVSLAQGAPGGFLSLMLAAMLYQAAGGAVVQGALAKRLESVTVADIMDREPVTIPAEVSLLDAHEQFFLRYSWPWFAVVDHARHFLGVLRSERVDEELAAGRPALAVRDVLERDLPVEISEQEPLETLLASEGLGRLGGMVAVDGDGVLRGIVTLAQIRQALRPAP
ncbi:MAG: site-2 protease family protein [Solirubrobacteraceae bacterium]